MRRLEDLYRASAGAHPDALAVVDRHGDHTYASIDQRADRLADRMRAEGIGRGDLVGIWSEKAAVCIVAMQAVLRTGAAYVPLDPAASLGRMASILAEAKIRCVMTTNALARRGASVLNGIPVLEIDAYAVGMSPARAPTEDGVADWLGMESEGVGPRPPSIHGRAPLDGHRCDDDLAYVLFTSGSTGTPKGVCITHRGALAFIDWAVTELRASEKDCFASHAPFHFDLSVLDIYASASSAARLVLVPEQAAYSPRALVNLIAAQQVSVWYSVPSALQLMLERGGLLERDDVAWHTVLFAGEVFPIEPLRKLRSAFPHARLLNLYGPTETNVCTFYEVHEIPEERDSPVPIGAGCCGDDVYAIREDGARAEPGDLGELHVSGPTVMAGYYGREPLVGPYATGDLVRCLQDGGFEFVGRRDHQIKIRGHRVELGAIEAALLESSRILEAVVVVRGEGLDAELCACVVAESGDEPSLIEAKQLCAARLPRYMVVDAIEVLPDLPRTPNGKIDRRALSERRASRSAALRARDECPVGASPATRDAASAPSRT